MQSIIRLINNNMPIVQTSKYCLQLITNNNGTDGYIALTTDATINDQLCAVFQIEMLEITQRYAIMFQISIINSDN
jgi:hypothetical protein